MNNIETRFNKIKEIENKLVLTKNDYTNIKDKMKEHYRNYINDEKLYNNYNALKRKINSSTSVNKSLSVEQRNIEKFKQDIYKKELRKIINFLLLNLERFSDFDLYHVNNIEIQTGIII